MACVIQSFLILILFAWFVIINLNLEWVLLIRSYCSSDLVKNSFLSELLLSI